ncbi:MAG: PQQ-binding-like beta-propeller repeat protein [Armatimonadetes bacterium]|nr:PQQ-binding-like beta-propeller repeat protein [Armatimonadota bacterium]
MTPDARYVLVNGDTPTLFVGSSGRAVRVSAWFRAGPVVDTDLSADGRYLAVVTRSGHLTVFSTVRGQPVWWTRLRGELFSLAVSEDGTRVGAASEETLYVFDIRTGARVFVHAFGKSRIASLGLSRDGRRAVVARKTPEGQLAVALLLTDRAGQAWERRLGPVSVPTLQVSRAGSVVKAGDFLGRAVTILSGDGHTLWRSPPGLEPVEAALSPDGTLAAVVTGSRVEIRKIRGQVLWNTQIPGYALSVRYGGPWVAVTGSPDRTQKVPDHVWFVRVPDLAR